MRACWRSYRRRKRTAAPAAHVTPGIANAATNSRRTTSRPPGAPRERQRRRARQQPAVPARRRADPPQQGSGAGGSAGAHRGRRSGRARPGRGAGAGRGSARGRPRARTGGAPRARARPQARRPARRAGEGAAPRRARRGRARARPAPGQAALGVSMELDKSFDPGPIEQRWYARWESAGYFRADPASSKPAYVIQLPPPNVTGTLHMGHAFQQTLMDALVRYHRMRGDNANWVVGTDHAGIATELVVTRQVEEEGKKKRELGRDKFIERVWEWKHQSGSTITRQMRRLGTSGNWEYADAEGQKAGYFTMDAQLSRAVTEVFVRWYEEGLIYRGKRLVNWDPVLLTGVSDLEVDTEEEDGRIWEIRYPGEGFSITVATVRPETMLGDVAVAVHPKDPRYSELVGKHVTLPLTGRKIPVIADDYVDPEFGSGAVKITPAHDFNDYAVGRRHNLEPISILKLDAHLNEQAPAKYRGLERFEARKKIIQDLRAGGFLVAEKPYKLRVPRSGRTGVIVEPMLTDQWFIEMGPWAKSGLEAVK